jgi:Spy/CpxP family protein refolding chaperone
MNFTRTLKTGALALMLTLGGVAAQAQPPMHGGPGGPGGEWQRGGMMMHGLKAVGASDAQIAQIKAIFQQAATDDKAAMDQLKTLHQQMEALFAASVIDANSITALANQAQTQHDAIATRMTRALIDAANVLTPDQRTKLQALRQQHADHAKQQRAPRGQAQSQ